MSTVLTRMIRLRRFARWVDRQGWARPELVTLAVLEVYRASVVSSCSARGHPHTWSSRISHRRAVRLGLRWAVDTHRLAIDPSAELTIPRMTRRLPRAVLAPDEVELVRCADVNAPLGLRSRAILEVMHSTGMRRAEVIRLGSHEVDTESGVVFIRKGKGGKDRVVPVGGRARGWVARNRDRSRPTLVARLRGGGNPPARFLGARGERIRPSRLTERIHGYVKRLSRTLGTGNLFRHGRATLTRDGGADIRDLTEMLVHA